MAAAMGVSPQQLAQVKYEGHERIGVLDWMGCHLGWTDRCSAARLVTHLLPSAM